MPAAASAGEREASTSYWAFQPVAHPAPPKVRDTAWVRTPVDRFILRELEARGIVPVADADKRTLIRRATYDLTGMPPTPAEIDAFLKDQAPDAFARVIDRLLASPAYGERWGRHWLDVVRYADTAGDNSDYPVPDLYKYRNWVIRAFQNDLPYDRFVQQQIAGDLMPAATLQQRFEQTIATGYLANARRFGSYEDARYPWHLTIEDTIDNLGRTFLALTINCCRCHDHKFDPLTSEDYYALYGFFSSTRYPWPGIELDKAPHDLIPLAPPDQVEAFEKERRQKMSEFDNRLKKIQKDKSDAEKALKETESIKSDAERKAKVAELTKKLDSLKHQMKSAQEQREKIAKQPMPYETAYAVAEGKTEGKKKVGNACVQIKGDPEHLGPEVQRRFPKVLGGHVLPTNTKGSGRLELARWLTDAQNPLTARVMVNRVWHFHFGKGLVATPSDFGKQGEPPSHPELLDYLAARFIDSGWSIKAMHRLIMTSRVYQLSSHAESTTTDPENRFLWHYRRQRMDAESIRDTLLSVSGMLDRSIGGPHPFPLPAKWDFTQHKPFKATYESKRRSVYLMVQRIQRHPFLGLFNGADTNASTARRVTSTTPLQALFVMNDPFVHEVARNLAARIIAESSIESGRIGRAFELLYGREALPEEVGRIQLHLEHVQAALGTTEQAAWESVARALLMNNELIYVE